MDIGKLGSIVGGTIGFIGGIPGAIVGASVGQKISESFSNKQNMEALKTKRENPIKNNLEEKTTQKMTLKTAFNINLISNTAIFKSLKNALKSEKQADSCGHFPANLKNIQVLKENIGGSTGAKLVQVEKQDYIQKTSGIDIRARIAPNHLRSEYYTNKAYQALGVNVPNVALYERDGKRKMVDPQVVKSDCPTIMLSEFIPGKTVELKDYLRIDGKIDEEKLNSVRPLIQKNFVADCLLANWDVIGAIYDNIRVDLETQEIWRVDNGSGLEFRAKGELKNQMFGDTVVELDSLRDPKVNREAASIFGSITDAEIIDQIDDILGKREVFLAALPTELQEKMSRRLDSLANYKANLSQKM